VYSTRGYIYIITTSLSDDPSLVSVYYYYYYYVPVLYVLHVSRVPYLDPNFRRFNF